MLPAIATAPLCARIAAGDEAAFAAFYDAWFDPAYALARTISRRDEAFCLDVVQDVMQRVVTKLPVLGTEDAVAAWMSKTVFSVTVDFLRREARRRRREERVAASVAEAHGGDSLLELERAEQRAWLAAALSRLPAQDQALLQARFGDGATLAAAGASLGITVDAAHGRIRRTLHALARAAKEWFGD
jgi:RNA polymerase sigma factor (sigma-70 family)